MHGSSCYEDEADQYGCGVLAPFAIAVRRGIEYQI